MVRAKTQPILGKVPTQALHAHFISPPLGSCAQNAPHDVPLVWLAGEFVMLFYLSFLLARRARGCFRAFLLELPLAWAECGGRPLGLAELICSLGKGR